jgi:hypothetical protein
MSGTESVEFVVRDDISCAKAAAAAFFLRKFRTETVKYWVPALIFSTFAVWLSAHFNGNTWVVGVYLVFLSIAILAAPLQYFACRSAAVRAVQLDPVRTVRLTSADVTVASDGNSTTLPWAKFRSISKYRGFVILARGGNSFWWFPLSSLSPEARSIIDRRAANGMK